MGGQDARKDTPAGPLPRARAFRPVPSGPPGPSGGAPRATRARSLLRRAADGPHHPPTWAADPYRKECLRPPVAGRGRAPVRTSPVAVVNAPALLRRELGAARWSGEHVTVGLTADCCPAVESRYALLPGVLTALRDHANPFSLRTASALVLRDLALLRSAAAVAEVDVRVTLGCAGEEWWHRYGTDAPASPACLDTVRELTGSGVPCAVVLSPVLPFLGDSPARLREAVRAVAAAGAVSVTPLTLRLPPGTRERFLRRLAARHPRLVHPYQVLYADGARPPAWYERRLTRQVRELAAEYGMRRAAAWRARPAPLS